MKKRMILRIALAALLSVGVYALAAPAPAAQAARSATTIVRTVGGSGYAAFILTNGAITRYVEMDLATQSMRVSPGKALTEPSVFVYVSEFNSDTQTLAWGYGQALAPDLTISKTLDTASLPPTSLSFEAMNENNAVIGTYTITVSGSWTGVGAVSYSHWVSHFRTPGVIIERDSGNGRWRDANASGSFSFTSWLTHTPVSVSGYAADYGQLSYGRTMSIIKQIL